MQIQSYSKYRENIRSGDLLIWSKDEHSTLSNSFLTLIRILTSSDFAHVGIAIRILGRLFVLEATLPNIRLALVSEKDEFYHIPMNVSWKQECEDYLFSKIGLLYSMLDAIRGYLGITVKNNNRYQCVELCREFYITCCGFDISENFKPKTFVKEILEITSSSIFLVKKQ